MKIERDENTQPNLEFYGGTIGILCPFILFVIGVIIIALSGAPDERGFWPVLIASLGLGLILAKDRTRFSEIVINGMSEKMVMFMIMAWMLASIIGILMTITGFVDALLWLSNQLNLGGTGFTLATFIVCCIVSISTGSSFATILICTPLFYPAGGMLGAFLPALAGAIIAGATFGDFAAPISDTTIASALSQEVEIGPTVQSRIKYVIPAALFALLAFGLLSSSETSVGKIISTELQGNSRGLPMLLVPAFIIYLFLKGKHLVHGLLAGVLFGTLLGLLLGLLPFEKIISLDLENFVAKSFIIDGINRAVGLSVFTILLMGLVASVKAGGLMDKVLAFANAKINSDQQAERWIASVMSTAVLLTTHSIVAILSIADFANNTGKKWKISGIRRANILSLIACVFPFLLPYFIPVILMANMTNSGQDYNIPSVSPLEIGMYNFMSLGLLFVLLVSLIFGWGKATNQ